jgi:hypothetical protein
MMPQMDIQILTWFHYITTTHLISLTHQTTLSRKLPPNGSTLYSDGRISTFTGLHVVPLWHHYHTHNNQHEINNDITSSVMAVEIGNRVSQLRWHTQTHILLTEHSWTNFLVSAYLHTKRTNTIWTTKLIDKSISDGIYSPQFLPSLSFWETKLFHT